MDERGGFVPYEFLLTRTPIFTLYGDNAAIFQSEERGTPQSLPPLLRAVLSEDQVQALLGFALGQGRLADAREQYENPRVADATSIVFTIDAGAIQKTVTIYALGLENEGDPDLRDKRAFQQVHDLVRRFESEARAGNVEELGLYEPAEYRVVLTELEPGQAELGAWPWPDVTIDQFSQSEAFGPRTTALGPDRIGEVANLPSGGLGGLPVEGPDGNPYMLSIRPLLPGEGARDRPGALVLAVVRRSGNDSITPVGTTAEARLPSATGHARARSSGGRDV